MGAQKSLGTQGTIVRWRLPGIHADGRKFVVVSALFAFFFWLLWPQFLAWPMIGVTLGIAIFFRDPIRMVPIGDNLIVSPSDGFVAEIKLVAPPKTLIQNAGLAETRLTCVSISMSVFDAHIQRAPVTGTVRRVVPVTDAPVDLHDGGMLGTEARQFVLIERSDDVVIGMTQIATSIGRHILTFIKTGDMVAVGQRIGLLRFINRVDVYLPEGTASRLVIGQRVLAGETILGVIGDATPAQGIAH